MEQKRIGCFTMVTDEPTTGTTNPRRRILWLVVGHVVVGPIAAWVAYSARRGPTLWGAAFIGIVFSQTSLLGIWGGLGTNPWWSRLIGIVVGGGFLGLLLGVSVGEREATYFIVSVGIALITGVLLVIRCFRVRVCVATVDQAAARRMQFTIRQLLVLTFAVACLVSLGKWLAPHLMNVTDPRILTLIGLILATVGLLSVWPALGARHPILPSLILIVVAASVGFCFAQFLPGPAGVMATFWMTITSVEALVLVASLVVVRSCGYRLVRLPSRRQGER